MALRSKQAWILALVAGTTTAAAFSVPAQAASVTVLANFSGPNGNQPVGGVIRGSDGALYGTTLIGGTNSQGMVYRLAPGSWTESVIYSFKGGVDGGTIQSGLAIDSKGVLYGTTQTGGSCTINPTYGCGTIYSLTPNAAKTAWTKKVLITFKGTNGAASWGSLTWGHDGALYGTTKLGGTSSFGTVFRLARASSTAPWTLKVLHNLGYSDGVYPQGSLAIGPDNSVYGTTTGGGGGNNGTVFQVSPPTSGSTWKFKVLHNFTGGTTDGSQPYGGLLRDPATGALFGTTFMGGSAGLGTAFRLAPAGKTNWSYAMLYSFGSGGSGDGWMPMAGMTLMPSGALYGTTSAGGANQNKGMVYKLTPNTAKTQWTKATVYDFTSADGHTPYWGALVADPSGALYGTNVGGGTGNLGTVFKLLP